MPDKPEVKLPDNVDLLAEFFKNLQFTDLITSNRVCKKWHQVAQAQAVLKTVLSSDKASPRIHHDIQVLYDSLAPAEQDQRLLYIENRLKFLGAAYRDALDENGNTALHRCAQLGDNKNTQRVAEKLLQEKINVNQINHESEPQTALQIATGEGHAEMTRILVVNGANTKCIDFNKIKTALDVKSKEFGTTYGSFLTVLENINHVSGKAWNDAVEEENDNLHRVRFLFY